MKPISLPIKTPELDDFRHATSCIIRRAYNCAKKGMALRSSEMALIGDYPDLDGHLFRCAVKRGFDLYEADKALKVETKIFGGKKEFIRRCKGLISNEEFKELRVQPLYSIGQANSFGNRRFQIDIENRKLIYIESRKGISHEWDIPFLKPNWEKILKQLAILANNKEIALTFMVSENMVNIIYDETKLDIFKEKYSIYKQEPFRNMGIDLNPKRLGIAIYEKEKVIYAESFELTSENQNIRKNELSHICDKIYVLMKHYGVARLGMENLTIKSKDHKKGKKFNKSVNMWIRKDIQNKMQMICTLSKVKFCFVNSAYSSFIGCLQHPSLRRSRRDSPPMWLHQKRILSNKDYKQRCIGTPMEGNGRCIL